ncbi:MAG: S41 family peptidase [Candidatus Peribacteraceae bacterium]|nr:S41 family peptidase [Candidatus Peribacteraceae bacterium]
MPRSLVRQFSSLFLLLCITLSPLGGDIAQAANVDFGSAPTVSRGDFIRGVIQVLNLPLSKGESSEELPFRRIPASLLPYIRVAHEANALGAFGDDLRLATPISRGEALRFIVELLKKQSAQPVSFRDVRNGTSEEKAVRVALEQGWMAPLRENIFGISRRLTGPQATELLGRVTGATAPERGNNGVQVPTIKIPLRPTGNTAQSSLPNQKILEAVWQIMRNDYLYPERIKQDEAVYSGIEAIVESLDDPYSRFMRPQDSRQFQTQIDGKVSGIGAQVEDRGGVLTIVTPIESSPAQKAGLRPNDKIIRVNGESLAGMSFSDAVEKVRGPQGSSVILTIDRDGVQFDVTVIRDTVKVPEISITWQGSVAVVKLMQFGRLTDTELRGLMEDVAKQHPTGIVLDLRNNPGGLLHAATVVLSNFLPQGSKVALIKSRKSELVEVTAVPATIGEKIPLIVIVNEGSASASEIVAGAIQDHQRGRVIGSKTFGKGTVQEVLEFTDNSSLKLTIAEWFTPLGRKIDGVGVEPDIEVPYDSGRDAQLLRALQLLR